MASILVVDDDYTLRRILRSFLETEGHDVVEAADGDAALAELGHHVIELVITDQTMPRMSGIELLRQMQRAFPHTKAIAVSGLDDAVELAVREPNVCVALRKPFGLRELSSALRSALRDGADIAGKLSLRELACPQPCH